MGGGAGEQTASKQRTNDGVACVAQFRGLSPNAPASSVQAVEEHGEAASTERQQAAAGSDAPEEQVAHAEEHRVHQREAQHPALPTCNWMRVIRCSHELGSFGGSWWTGCRVEEFGPRGILLW